MTTPQPPTGLWLKRAFDTAVAGAALIVLFAPLLLLGLAVLIDSGRPVLYWSKRAGRLNRPFSMPKFRTLRIEAPEKPSDQIDQGAYVTRLGRLMRKGNLDELPQLWSIVAGDMSLVGPRPALTTQTRLLAMRTKLGAHALRPGLTGYAQVIDREEHDDFLKAGYDYFYLIRRSFWIDLAIIAATVSKLLPGRRRSAGR